MKKLPTMIIVGLLWFSTFSMLAPNAKGLTVDISAQYSSFVSAFNNFKKIFGQDVVIGQTVDRTLSGVINDLPARYPWNSWAGQTYVGPPDGFSVRIETIQPDYVYKIIGLGYMGGGQPSASGWIKVNSPFVIEQINNAFNYSWPDGSNVRLFVNKDTGDITFSAKWYNWPALVDATTFEFAITIAKPGGVLPPFSYDTTRGFASYAYDTDTGQVVMLGGRTWDAMSLKSDLWTFNPASSQWTSVTAVTGPSNRITASMSYNPVTPKLLVFGGGTDAGEASDTWTFQITGPNTGAWAQIAGTAPPPRSGAPMVFDSKNSLFVLFGGERYVYSLGDTWVFDPSSNTWINKNPSPSPSQRARAAMAYDAQSGKVLLFGGLNKGAGALLSDTWLYDAATNTWRQVSTATAPSARQWPSLASDGNGVFYLFGGWRVDAGGGLGQYLDDTWKFDMATTQWTQLFPSESPIAQSQGKLLHIGSGKFVLMGGWRDGPLGEIWFYDGNQNIWSAGVPSPPVPIPWRDEFDYNTKEEMKSAGWILDEEVRISVGGGLLTLDNDGAHGCGVKYMGHFLSGINDFQVEAKSKWISRAYGSRVFYVWTQRHRYGWFADGYYPEYAFIRYSDGWSGSDDKVLRFGGYAPAINEWATMALEKRGNVFYMYQDGQLKNTYTEADSTPDALVGVSISGCWLSTVQYDYISVATPAQPDFEISVSPESQIGQPVSSVYYEIKITSWNGFSSSVTLNALFSPNPLNYGYHLLPAIITPPPNGECTATLEFEIYDDTPLKIFTITVTATSGAIVKTYDVKLNIERSLEVPYQNQEDTGWCGPTSLAMILGYYGYMSHSWDYAWQKSLSSDKGTTPWELQNYIMENYPTLTTELRDYALLDKEAIFRDIKSYISSGSPVILNVGTPPIHQVGHYVVVVGYNDTGLFLNDPSSALFALIIQPSIPRESYNHAYVDWDTVKTYIATRPLPSILSVIGSPNPRHGKIYFGEEEIQMLSLYDLTEHYFLDLDKGLMWKHAKGQKPATPDNVIHSYCDRIWWTLHVSNSKRITQSFQLTAQFICPDGGTYPLPNLIINDVGSFSQKTVQWYWGDAGMPTLNDILNTHGSGMYFVSFNLKDSTGLSVDSFVTDGFYLGKNTKMKLSETQKHLYLHVYDSEGNHIGLNYATNMTELGIPNSYYFDDGNGTIIIVLPQIMNLTTVVDATYAEESVEYYNLTVTVTTDSGVYSENYSGNITKGEKQTFITEVTETSLTLFMRADIDVKPDTLNLGSKGNWITAYVELYEGVNVGSINVSSILLNNSIPIDPTGPVTVGDYDGDGIPDLMVKFDRTSVQSLILSKGITSGSVVLTLSGKLNDRTLFEGSDTIRIVYPVKNSGKQGIFPM